MGKLKYKYRLIWIALLTIVGAAINAFGVKVFMRPMHLVPLGATGTAVVFEQIAKRFFNWNLSYIYLYFIINFIVAIWAYFKISKHLVYKSFLYVIAFTITSWVLPDFTLSNDKFINTVSGAMCNAIGNLFVMFVGGTAAGYNFIGLYLSSKYKKSMVGTVNTTNDIFSISIISMFFGVEKGIMSVIASVLNSFIIDKFHNQSNYVSLFIVTKKPNLFTHYATEKLNRSATLIDSIGSYSQTENTTLILTISKYKFSAVKRDLTKIDPNAHITIYNVSQIIGNMKSKVGKSVI